ncbi:MAG: hypothetical protein ABIA04_15640 [Pseudomonadota bacterium]
MKKLLGLYLIFMMIFAFTQPFLACLGSDDQEDAAENGETDDIDTSIPDGFARINGFAIPAAIPGAIPGLLKNAEDTESYVQEASVYVIGQETSKVYTDEDGYYSLLVDTTTSPVVTSNYKAATETQSFGVVIISPDSNYGRKFEVELSIGDNYDVPDIEIPTTGVIAGTVTLQGQSDHTGIDVYIPGTSFSAKTDSDGDFTISNVPEGLYDFLRAEKDGYRYAVLSEIQVQREETTSTDSLELILSTGASGAIQINSGDNISTSLSCELTIAATDDAVLMMVAEDVNFTGGSWQAISSTLDHTFTDEGENTVYIKFADANGLESSYFSDSITIMTNPTVTLLTPSQGQTIAETLPSFDWSDSPLSSSTYTFILASDSNFSNVIKQVSSLTSSTYTLTTVLDDLEQYYWSVKIVDEDANSYSYASAYTFSIDLSTVTLSSPSSASITNDTTPSFSWSANANAASYTFVLSESSDLSNPVVQETGITSTSHTLTSALPDTTSTTYYWAVTPVDENEVAGTRSDIWNFELDNTGPTGSVTINSGDTETSNTTVSLTISATDENTVSYMYISTDGTFTDGAWEAYSTSATLTFDEFVADDSATMTAYIKFKDNADNLSDSYNDSIDLARTLTSGSITLDETWALADSPFVIIGNVGVASGVTLTIEAGVEVLFDGAYTILILGDITAVGTDENPITFTSNTASTSSGATMLKYEQTNLSDSSLSYLEMSYAAKAIHVGDETELEQDPTENSGTLTIGNTTIDNAEVRTGGYDTAAAIVFNTPTISNSTIIGESARSEPITFNNGTISDSTIVSDSYNNGITISGVIVSDSEMRIGCCGGNITINSSSNISNTRIYEYSGAPISGPLEIDASTLINVNIDLPYAQVNFTDSMVYYNTLYLTYSFGTKMGNGTITESVFDGTSGITGFEITGSNGYSTNGTCSIDLVDINDFATGIYLSGGSGAFSITDSNLHDNTSYALNNGKSIGVTATGNWWGSDDEATIESYIYDNDDDISLGDVDYLGYLSAEKTGTGPQ